MIFNKDLFETKANEVFEISKEEYLGYTHDPDPKIHFFLEQTNWFRNRNGNLLATITFDQSEDDWGFFILAKENDNVYRMVDYLNQLNEEEAEMRLHLNMALMSVEGKEQIFSEETEFLVAHKLVLTDINQEVKRYFAKHPDKLHELSPRKFEELIAEILKDFGFEVELTRATRDGGSDIIAHIRNSVASFMMLVECKRYAPQNKVDVGIIREVIGVHTIKKPAKSLIVTTSTFTKDAILQAEHFKENLELKDYHHIKEWLKRYT